MGEMGRAFDGGYAEYASVREDMLMPVPKGLTPEEARIIGDFVSSDISGGIDYGMHTCLYQKNTMPGRNNSGADHVVGSLSEIKRIL